MNSVPSAIRSRKAAILAVGLGLILGCASSAAPPSGTKDAAVYVWPSPPDPPRIKFIEVLRSNRDVEGKTKRNLKEILLGIEPDRLAVTLKRPIAVTTDSTGRVLVVDTENHGIFVFDRSAHSFALYGGTGEGALMWPMGIDVDAQDNIYVTDHKKKALYKYDSAGRYLLSVGGFDNPVGVAVDRKRNRVYVVDSKAHHVQILDLEGKKLDTIGERGEEEGQFNFPTYCAVDGEGSLYVVDTANARVEVFDAKGEVVGTFGSLGTGLGQFVRPKGIAVDRWGIIYVVDAAFNNVQLFNKEFQLLMPLGQRGTDPGQFWLPSSIHVDDRDGIYVTDYMNSRLQIFQLLSEGLETEEPVKKN